MISSLFKAFTKIIQKSSQECLVSEYRSVFYVKVASLGPATLLKVGL